MDALAAQEDLAIEEMPDELVVSRRIAWKTVVVHCAVWASLITICWASLLAGLGLRRWTFDITEPVRFTGDIRRGCSWGIEASGPEGLLNQYEKMANEQPHDGRWLDYAPLRLLVMSRWGAWIRQHEPAAAAAHDQDAAWRPAYAFNAPVLRFNTAMELIGAVAAFFLTRQWVIRGDNAPAGGAERRAAPHFFPGGDNLSGDAGWRFALPRRRPHRTFRGWAAGLIAALLWWFNPAAMLSAYGWPTWDAWIVPIFLLAALAASYDWWFAAGLAVAVGAMFKGQQLAVAPIFLLWPLVQGRAGAAARWVVGFAIGMAAIASPWLVTYLPADQLEAARATQARQGDDPPGSDTFAIARKIDGIAITWVVGSTLLVLASPAAAAWQQRREQRQLLDVALAADGSLPPDEIVADRFQWRRWHRSAMFWRIALPIVVAAWVIWPWILHRNRPALSMGAVAASLAVAATFLPWRWAWRYAAASTLTASLLLCMSVFRGSTAWWVCGFQFGTIHWPFMVMGQTSNLPGLLAMRYQWPINIGQDITGVVACTLPRHALLIWPSQPFNVSTKAFFGTLYTITLLICGTCLGRAARRNDRRVLVCLVAPWVMFFTLPCQIHERYLLFAAGTACILAGYNVGMTLLGLFLTAVTWIMTLHVMFDANPRGAWVLGESLAKAWPKLFDPTAGESLRRFVVGTHPDIAWAVATAAGVFLYMAIVPGRLGWRANPCMIGSADLD